MNFGLEIPDDDTTRAGLANIELPWADALGAVASHLWVHNPDTEAAAATELALAQHPWLRLPAKVVGTIATAIPGGQNLLPATLSEMRHAALSVGDADRFLDPAELNSKYGEELGLSFDRPMRSGAVDITVRRKREQISRNAMLAHQPNGLAYGIASFATQLAVSAVDPLNVASAFIPVVSEARFGLWAARYGKTLARVGRGAVEGAAGAALVEPIVYGTEKAYQGDYDLMDSFLNVAVGSVLGGGLHAGFGALSDRLNLMSESTRIGALRGAVAQMAEGREVDIGHIIASDPVFTRARSDIDAMRATRPAAKGETILDAVVRAGGLKLLRDESGALTKEGQDVAFVLEGTKRPGLLNKEGLTPDDMRKSLEADGWFGVREAQSSEMDDLYDAISRHVRGEPVYHPNAMDSGDASFREAMDREMTEAGVSASDGPRTAARKLAEYRKQDHAGVGDLLRRADDLGVYHDETSNLEELQFEVLEREAMRDENLDADRLLDAARSNTEAFNRGEAPSSASSPEAAESAVKIVRESFLDDDAALEAQLTAALDELEAFEGHGVLAPEDVAEVAGALAGIQRAEKFGKAAKAAARCLLLHP